MFGYLHNAKSGSAIWDVLERIRIEESSTTWCEMTKVEWVAFCGPNA